MLTVYIPRARKKVKDKIKKCVHKRYWEKEKWKRTYIQIFRFFSFSIIFLSNIIVYVFINILNKSRGKIFTRVRINFLHFPNYNVKQFSMIFLSFSMFSFPSILNRRGFHCMRSNYPFWSPKLTRSEVALVCVCVSQFLFTTFRAEVFPYLFVYTFSTVNENHYERYKIIKLNISNSDVRLCVGGC